MATWSSIRHKLENDYLAQSLRGHIQYYVTTYNKSHDHEGRAAIRLDGKEILCGSYYTALDSTYTSAINEESLNSGAFDQRCFYSAFEEFDNQSIDESIKSDNLLITIFALLDRRIGKRRLNEMKESIQNQPEVIQMFYNIRMDAEGLN
ncbi:MAG: hypothetical protein NC122_03840 [Faecalibacterium sp.]|nr:hypothetical protein [Ruminococcus sp.]MCM1392901.1 hypothetical protein [Ruminococcus sp.]MCM1485317.1 hypothetical protein [Faecalibacterium sp.]